MVIISSLYIEGFIKTFKKEAVTALILYIFYVYVFACRIVFSHVSCTFQQYCCYLLGFWVNLGCPCGSLFGMFKELSYSA